jgi:hypothetical protein
MYYQRLKQKQVNMTKINLKSKSIINLNKYYYNYINYNNETII